MPEPIKKIYSKELPLLHMRKGALKRIFELIPKEAKLIELQDGNHKYNSIQDFWDNAPPKLNELTLRFRNDEDWITIELRKRGSIFVHSTQPHIGLGTLTVLYEEICKSKRYWAEVASSFKAVVTFMLFSVIAGQVAAAKYGTDFGLVSIPLFLIFAAVFWIGSSRVTTVILPQDTGVEIGFSKEAKDVIVQIISGVILLAVGWIANALYSKPTEAPAPTTQKESSIQTAPTSSEVAPHQNSK